MASLITDQPKSENDKVDPDFQELLDEFKESKNKEEAAAAMKASLPAMESSHDFFKNNHLHYNNEL